MTLGLGHAAAVLLGALALTLGSCSGMRLAYDYADNYFVGTVQDYFEPSPEQMRAVRANADQVLAWHRREELPSYILMFDQAAQKVADGLTEEEVLWGMAQVRSRYDALAQRILAVNAPLLARLSAGNFAALEAKFASENAKLEQSYVNATSARREERRIERVQRQLERWIGALDAKQRAIIAAWVAAAPNAAQDWHRERITRQQDLLAVLRGAPDAGALSTRVTEIWLRGATASAGQRNRQEMRLATLLIEIDQSLSAAQRERAVQRMLQYAQDFRALLRIP